MGRINWYIYSILCEYVYLPTLVSIFLLYYVSSVSICRLMRMYLYKRMRMYLYKRALICMCTYIRARLY